MLTRLYIDNFKCFVKFEYRPARKQLIMGPNGSGKTSLLDALLFVRQFAVKGISFEDFFILNQRTRWLNQAHQIMELEATLDDGRFIYRLVIEPWGEPPTARVRSETVHLDGRTLFEFNEGEVHLYDDEFEHKVAYPLDGNRSALALATTAGGKHDKKLNRFRRWLAGLYCFKINPFSMGPRAEKEDHFPNVDLSNIAAWYRHLIQDDPGQNGTLVDSLRAALEGFRLLKLESWGENVRLLVSEFTQDGGNVSFGFGELSDGQRCLICLYTILHFVLAKGNTVILDEPDNFISLREIQPWLMAVADTVEEGGGQIILISHHPELINQWAPSCGVQFVRDGIGPVRIEEFPGDVESVLSPAELIARGWENG